jgi:hypothetical protein
MVQIRTSPSVIQPQNSRSRAELNPDSENYAIYFCPPRIGVELEVRKELCLIWYPHKICHRVCKRSNLHSTHCPGEPIHFMDEDISG